LAGLGHRARRRPGPGFASLLAIVAVVLLLIVVPGVPAGTSRTAVAGVPRLAPSAPPLHEHGPDRSMLAAEARQDRVAAAGNCTFVGQVIGVPYVGGPGSPIAGATVDILAIDRTTVLATTTTDSIGTYSITFGIVGSYYVASAPFGSWGGGWPSGNAPLAPHTFFSTATVSVDLYAYPRLSYNNETVVLPGWNNLSGYLDNGNGHSNGSYIQQPVLSWVQNGVYYVNASNDLVFYSFPNATTSLVHPWVLLYTNIMGYAGWQNEFYLTQDGQYAYGAGCLRPCSVSANVTVFAVNLTTDRAFEHNFTAFNASAGHDNAQVNMVGYDGNASTVVFFPTSGVLHEWNLWNGTEWVGGRLSYFEANNAYWVPYLNSFVNFRAEGSKADQIEQWALAANGLWTRVFAGKWYSGGFIANGVNGLYLNVTSHLLWTGVDYQGGIQSFAYNWSANGTLDQEVYFAQVPANTSKYPGPVLIPQISSDEHRFTLVSSGPAFQTGWWPYGGNDSFVVDPTPSHTVYYSSNVSVDHMLNGTYYPTQAYADSQSLDGQFFNTTRLVSYYSYDCNDHLTKTTQCPVAGNAPDSTPGTIYYVWRSDLSANPNPLTNGQAQTSPAPDPTLAARHGADWVNVSWTEAASPIVNYTVSWGLGASDLPHSVSVYGQNSSFNLTGLADDATYYFRVVALNLHAPDAGSTVNATLVPVAGLPTGLRQVAANATNITVAWSNPALPPLVNDTVYVGSPCGVWTQVVSVGVVTSAVVSGLQPVTQYCVAVAAWSTSGEGPRSTTILAETASVPHAPQRVRAAAESSSAIWVGWTNPPGPLTNVTVYVTPGCVGGFQAVSVGVGVNVVVGSLRPNSTYCFAVAAWNSSGEGPKSAPIQAATFPLLPDPPTNLTLASVGPTYGNLTWTLPMGPAAIGVRNVTVFQGPSCGVWASQVDLGRVANAWQATNLTPSSNYAWAVALWNSSGEGSASECASGTTLSVPAAPSPGAITALSVVAPTPTSATLEWSYGPPAPGVPAKPVGYYVIDIGPNCSSPDRAIVVSGAPANVPGLTPSHPFCLSLAAFFRGGAVVSGGSVSLTTPVLSILTPSISRLFLLTPPGGDLLLVGGLAAAAVAAWLIVRRGGKPPGSATGGNPPAQPSGASVRSNPSSGRRRSPVHRGPSGSR